MRTAHLLRTLVLTLVGAVFATAAGAVDMTGTWEGKERCNCFNEVDGKFTERYRGEVMKITQDGADLNIEAYGELFNGNVIGRPHRDSKGEASLIACHTDPTDNASFGEIGRAKVSAKANGRGRMTIKSLWNAQSGQTCTCTSKMHRTDASDPEIDDCSGGNAVDKWHKAMLEIEESVGGCYKAEYPSPHWTKVTCAAPSSKRSRSFSRPPGGGESAFHDSHPWAVKVSGVADAQLMKVTGSFKNIRGVTTIRDSVYGENHYTLQLNSNFFMEGSPQVLKNTSSACDSSFNPKCQGWVQYVYINSGNDLGSMTIWYILSDYTIDADDTPAGDTPPPSWPGYFCPQRNQPPFWQLDNGTCYMQSVSTPVPTTTVAQLGEMHLTGIADPSQKVEHAVIRVEKNLYRATVTDSYLWFNGKWTQAEFNVCGYGNGSRVNFNAGSSLDVRFVVGEYFSGRGGTLTCDPLRGGEATTGETNNLKQGRRHCKMVPHSALPTFTFNENNM